MFLPKDTAFKKNTEEEKTTAEDIPARKSAKD